MMKQKLLLTGLMALMLVMTSMRGWGQILTFEFSALAGDEVSAVSNANDANLTPSTITRGAGLTAAGNGGRFNATNWAVTSIANAVSGNNYMEFTITPQSGYQFSVSSIYIQLQRSGTGPRGIAIRNSVDSYAANLDQEYAITDITSTQSFTFTFSQSASSSAVTYRVYMWAEATGGSGGIGDGSGDDIIVSGVVTAVGGNQPPSITNVMHTPISGVTSSTSVAVSADITDSDGTIEGAELHWGTGSGSLGNTISMSLGAGSTYTTDTDIPAQAGGSTVYYEVYALDNEAGDATSPEQSYVVLFDEPTEHATSFTEVSHTHIEAVISWTDAVPASDAYLIKASLTSYAAIEDPVNGVAEANSTLVQNVADGVETVSFSNLDPSTPYYFKIFPYNGSSDKIAYKTDGTVPQVTISTDAAPEAPHVFISEYIEGTSNNKAIEIFNGTGADLSLNNFKLKIASGGSGWGTTLDLSSKSLLKGAVYVVYNSGAGAQIIDQGDETSGVTFYNGDDAIGLFYEDVLIDVIGLPDSDPGTAWQVAGISNATAEHTLVRKSSINQGNTNWAASAGTDADDSEWIVSSQDDFSYLGWHNNFRIWEGSIDVDFTTSGNWAGNKVPGASDIVIIPGGLDNYPLADGDPSSPNIVSSFEIRTGASISIAPSKAISVLGTLTNDNGNSGVLIQSNLNGTGSLIHSSDNVSATIQRYITGNSTTNGTYDYHTVSVPLNSNGTAGLFTGSYLYQFNTTTQLLESMGSDVNTVLPNNQGYMIFYPEAFTTYNFTGQLNNGDFPIPTAQGLDEFTLAPNPYPSAIDWDAAAGWTKTNLYDAYWIWNPAADNYAAYGTDVSILNATQYIPVGQAFFVKANAAASALTVKNEARVHNDQAFFKNQTATQNLLRVKTATSESADEMIVRFMADASNGPDPYDIDKIIGGSAAPQLYSLINTDRMATVNTLAYSAETLIVPVAYELSNNETASLNFEGVDSFDPTVEIFLEDLMTNQMINLRETASYQFNHAASNTPDRFRLHFMGVTVTPEIGQAADRLKVWTAGDQLYIHTSQPQGESLQIDLFDANGRLLQSLNKANESPVVISSRTMQGLILVRVTGINDVQTQKVFIR